MTETHVFIRIELNARPFALVHNNCKLIASGPSVCVIWKYLLSSQFTAQSQCEKIDQFDNAQYRNAHEQAQQTATARNEVRHCGRFRSIH